MSLAWRTPKDPEEILDYLNNWDARLETDETILTSVWEVTGTDDALTVTDDSIEDTDTVIWFSGGTLGERYLCTNTITTSEGRTLQGSIYLKVKAK